MKTVEVEAMLNNEDRHWWYRGRRRIVLHELAQIELPPGARLLDAGCGSGRLLDELSRRGEVSAIDMNPDSVAIAKERGHDDVHVGAVESLPWPDETFDLVTSLDVLEHTADDRVALAEYRRVTREGGAILITVPAFEALWSRHDVQNQHYRRYDRPALRALAQDVGVRVERVTYFNSLLLPAAAAVRFWQQLTGRGEGRGNGNQRSDVDVAPAWMSPGLELPLQLESKWLERRRALPAGLSLLAVLRR
jgi:SAM-dependent methyltransferase